MFRHITLYHQNESKFEMTCDLHSTCGVLYRTYSAYKSHIYRKHLTELHSIEEISNTFSINDQQKEDTNFINETDSFNTYHNNSLGSVTGIPEAMLSNDYSYNNTSDFDINLSNEESIGSIKDIKKSYVLFILQLREEFLLPKNVTNVIATYITTLIDHIKILSEKKTFNIPVESHLSTSSMSQQHTTKAINFNHLLDLFVDIRGAIECITKNEYQFMKYCSDYFGYNSVQEINVSSNDEVPDCGYFIPIDETLSLMLNSQMLVSKIFENIDQQQSIVQSDGDLMFSIRDSYNGLQIDDDHLLIQLYLDDISLTNPLGSKRDRHKMSMIYFMLEDIPDQYRSKLDFIQLMAICESRILKVKIT
ncbi:unnamed protein product [Adineta steineri]|uniref:C2H2-type domain-containing protein n=1 Tax=Adineta steineri TaxID=433720 RepID=A0A815RRX0_9BILA|nr:unnamed protein product [Adineta steineri]CAF1638734.1 unnamed protein product [Adineta steineri]